MSGSPQAEGEGRRDQAADRRVLKWGGRRASSSRMSVQPGVLASMMAWKTLMCERAQPMTERV
jgi:hypothetical protein